MKLISQKIQQFATILGLAVCFCVIQSNTSVSAETSSLTTFDQCLKDKGAAGLRECQALQAAQTVKAGDIDTKTDATDQTFAATNFRFAGAGLSTSQVGDPYDVGTNEVEWKGSTGCLKYEKTIKKAQFKREDGVVSELPVLDVDGNTIPGTDIAHGDKCDSSLDFEVKGNSHGASTGGWSGWSAGSSRNIGEIVYISCTRTQSGTAYSYTDVEVTRTIIRDGEAIGQPEKGTCRLSNSAGYTAAHTGQLYEGSCGSNWNKMSPSTTTFSPSYPAYPTLTGANKGTCATQLGWNFNEF